MNDLLAVAGGNAGWAMETLCDRRQVIRTLYPAALHCWNVGNLDSWLPSCEFQGGRGTGPGTCQTQRVRQALSGQASLWPCQSSWTKALEVLRFHAVSR